MGSGQRPQACRVEKGRRVRGRAIEEPVASSELCRRFAVEDPPAASLSPNDLKFGLPVILRIFQPN